MNDRYRWEIWELWLDRHNKLEHPGKIVATGWDLTLEQAKKSALAVLEPFLCTDPDNCNEEHNLCGNEDHHYGCGCDVCMRYYYLKLK